MHRIFIFHRCVPRKSNSNRNGPTASNTGENREANLFLSASKYHRSFCGCFSVLTLHSKWVSFISCLLVPCHRAMAMGKNPGDVTSAAIQLWKNICAALLKIQSNKNVQCVDLLRWRWRSKHIASISYSYRISIVDRFCQKQNKSSYFQWKSRREIKSLKLYSKRCGCSHSVPVYIKENDVLLSSNYSNQRKPKRSEPNQTKPNQYSKTPPWPEVIKKRSI